MHTHKLIILLDYLPLTINIEETHKGKKTKGQSIDLSNNIKTLNLENSQDTMSEKQAEQGIWKMLLEGLF